MNATEKSVQQLGGSFTEHAPSQRNVHYAKFLVQSTLSADSGVKRAVAVVKYFGVWENAPESEGDVVGDRDTNARPARVTSEYVGRGWRARGGVKAKMSVAARKKFGGCLLLK